MSDKLREALSKALAELNRHDGDYDYRTNPDVIALVQSALAQPQNDAEAVVWRSRSTLEPDWIYHETKLAPHDMARKDDQFEEQPLYTAPPSPERMGEALEVLSEISGSPKDAVSTEILANIVRCIAFEALRAGDNHASDGKESEGGDQPSNETAGGFPVAAAPYQAEETGVIQPTRQGAGVERGTDQCVTRGESAAPSDPTPPDREAIARVIYDAFPFMPTLGCPSKPAWIDNGNSIRQADARRAADRILALRGGE